jgi:acyl carrier protein
MKIIEEILPVISEITNVNLSELTSESKSSNTENWDSLAQLQIIMGLEKKFDVRFKTSEISELTSVLKLTDRIKVLLKTK